MKGHLKKKESNNLLNKQFTIDAQMSDHQQRYKIRSGATWIGVH